MSPCLDRAYDELSFPSESDWERSNQSKIRNVPGNAELGRDIEQGPSPHDCAEAHVNGAQYSIRVRHDEVREVRIGKLSNIEASCNRGARTDRERATHPKSYDI
jgi:hypothetical protein